MVDFGQSTTLQKLIKNLPPVPHRKIPHNFPTRMRLTKQKKRNPFKLPTQKQIPFSELQSYTAGQLRDNGRTRHRVVTLLIAINNCL